jgi:hypothetical protein
VSAAAKYVALRRIILENPAKVRPATEEAIEFCRRVEARPDGPRVEKLLRWWYLINFESQHGPLFDGKEPRG